MSRPVIFQSIEDELRGVVANMRGRALNMGCGDRDISAFIMHNSQATMVVNADIAAGMPGVVVCDILALPFAEATFDSILCNAVLEHVSRPFEAVAEMDRALKPGGIMILCAPFMQPFHASPHDYFRYTASGLRALCPDSYEVLHLQPVHGLAQTLGWLIWEYVSEKGSRPLKALVWPWLRLVTWLFHGTDLKTSRSANGFQMVLVKK